MSNKHDAVSSASTVATLGWVTACVLLLAGCSAGNVEDMPGYEEGFAAGKAQGLEEGKVQGKEEGLEEGKEEGLEEGKAQGKAEGLEEGKEEGKQEVCDDAMAQLPDVHGALVSYGICD
jgi:flagellar biosynthesis/type III secretory pathway protein FliH